MIKIQCPECSRSFMWTDDMPMKGNCPNSDCKWHYDVNEEIRKSAEKKMTPEGTISCPNCGKPISSKITICDNCGNIVIGTRFFTQKRFFIIVASVIILIGAIYKLYSYLK